MERSKEYKNEYNSITNEVSTDKKVDEILISELRNLVSDDTVSLEAIEALVERGKDELRRKDILEKHKPKPKLLKKGLWYTRIDGKQVTAKTLEALEEKIISHYDKKVTSINSIFDNFLRWRKIAVSHNTWMIDIRTHEKYIKDSKLGTMSLKKITLTDAEEFLMHCKKIKPDMKRKYWDNQILATLNAMFRYMIIHQMRKDNPFEHLYIGKDFFDPPKKLLDKDKVFSAEEQQAVMAIAYEYAAKNQDISALGINLLFCTGIRIGELCALRWKDLENQKLLHVQRELVINRDENGKCDGHKVLEHCKSPAGDRKIPLNSQAKEILMRVRHINEEFGYPVGEDDFIFSRRYRGELTCCSERSFFTKLKRYCEKAGMEVAKSPHDIRRTVITNLYCAGMNPKAIQRYAGHSTLEQTLDYVKFIDDKIDEDAEFYELLGSSQKSNISPFIPRSTRGPQDFGHNKKLEAL
ncbi:MAG: site-specific integrase [Lachnospiraceae bacterium]|nr:site-specific integrase [Lachnospiraceae bacterium]